MPHITLRLKNGDKEAEVTLEDPFSYDDAKTLLFELMDRNAPLTAREALISMAQKGSFKPLRMTNLGKCLDEYTNKSSDNYDEEFDQGMRELVPNWFDESEKVNDI